MAGVTCVMAVLTAESRRGRRPQRRGGAAVPESPRVQQARAAAAARQPGAAPASRLAGAARQRAGSGVKHMIAVASGKGGVGKSTTAVNLALGFQAIGLKAGILDADIYGPSQPRLWAYRGPQVAGNRLQPDGGLRPQGHVDRLSGRRGHADHLARPMVVSALNQMLRDVAWGELDVLVIDMPPGTGDVQLTMAQQVPLSGAIIVSTPQDLALIDARKGLDMFRKVDVPVLGIIENMSYFVCPKCGERTDIFGHGGAQGRGREARHPLPRRRAAAHGYPRHLRRGPADRGHAARTACTRRSTATSPPRPGRSCRAARARASSRPSSRSAPAGSG